MGWFWNKKEKETTTTDSLTSSCLGEHFRMVIEDVFLIIGRGVVVVGRIESGMCRVSENVQIQTASGILNSTITGIEMYRKATNIARRGENVGILLRGVTRDDLSKGDVLLIENGGLY